MERTSICADSLAFACVGEMQAHPTRSSMDARSFAVVTLWALYFAEAGDFGVADCGDVPAVDQELHDVGALAREFGPARGSGGILLKAADALAGKLEIDLGELGFCGVLDGIGIVAYTDARLAFDQG